VEPLIDAKLATMKYYTGRVTRQMNKVCIVSRTGYTGEDGCELIVKAEDAPRVWENLLLAGREVGLQAAGLGARDTLRLEAAMPLYGHELSEDIHPFQAGLGFAVNLRDRDFVGRTSLLKLKDDDSIRRVGLELSGRRVPREHYQLFDGEQFVGEVTSGTFSPTLDRPLAMAYVASAVAQSGRELTVDIRGTRLPARIVDLPFYKRPA
ncbi:MAG: glycine cleavage system protein T, partial [Planctomycetales bacterium]|nr:glycine cleavage system protein T [Planctomycetales bacterium]